MKFVTAAAAAIAVLGVQVCPSAKAACIQQKLSSQVEEYYVDGLGNPASRLVQTRPTVQGEELIYTLLVTNICKNPQQGAQIDFSIPPNIVYTKTTAKGDNTDRLFSIDGVSYARWDSLVVRTQTGVSRPASPEDIKAIRWVFKSPVAPNHMALLHFHAVAK